MADVVVTNKVTLDQVFNEKEFDTTEGASDFRDNVLANLKADEYSHWAKVYPVVICACGAKIICTGFTNTCDRCDSDYNFAGALLAPREQWGEETGEHCSECY